MKRIDAEISQLMQKVPAPYYCTAYGATARTGDFGLHEIIVRNAGKPDGSALFNPDEWALVIKGVSRAKAEAIIMILNAPEPNR